MCVDVNFKPWLSTGLVAAEIIRTGPPERIGLSGIGLFGPHQFLEDTLILFQSRRGAWEHVHKLRPPNRIVPTNIF